MDQRSFFDVDNQLRSVSKIVDVAIIPVPIQRSSGEENRRIKAVV